jgi:hypothetical protein
VLQLSFPKRHPEGHAEVNRWMDVLAVQQEAAVLKAQAEVDRALAADAYVTQFVSRVEVVPRAKDAYQVPLYSRCALVYSFASLCAAPRSAVR